MLPESHAIQQRDAKTHNPAIGDSKFHNLQPMQNGCFRHAAIECDHAPGFTGNRKSDVQSIQGSERNGLRRKEQSLGLAMDGRCQIQSPE